MQQCLVYYSASLLAKSQVNNVILENLILTSKHISEIILFGVLLINNLNMQKILTVWFAFHVHNFIDSR